MEQIKRSRQTAKEIRQLLELFDSSGLSAKQFCITNGINETVFYKWRGRYRTLEEKNDFIPLQVASRKKRICAKVLILYAVSFIMKWADV